MSLAWIVTSVIAVWVVGSASAGWGLYRFLVAPRRGKHAMARWAA